MSHRDDETYEDHLRTLQIELVKLQRHTIASNRRVLVILEGRDGAGKDGTLKRITEHMSPRDIRMVALSKPSDRERSQWYFQRYVSHLPAHGEFVFFNRSWYNRAGVEPVMGFCTPEEYENFMRDVIPFEELLVRSGITVFKYYLDISQDEQRQRLDERHRDPLKQWKSSPIDDVALKKWKNYSHARNVMLQRTHHAAAPWTVIIANHKKAARLSLISHFLSTLEYPDKDASCLDWNSDVVLEWPVGGSLPQRLAE